jgi:hypothetical protein
MKRRVRIGPPQFETVTHPIPHGSHMKQPRPSRDFITFSPWWLCGLGCFRRRRIGHDEITQLSRFMVTCTTHLKWWWNDGGETNGKSRWKTVLSLHLQTMNGFRSEKVTSHLRRSEERSGEGPPLFTQVTHQWVIPLSSFIRKPIRDIVPNPSFSKTHELTILSYQPSHTSFVKPWFSLTFFYIGPEEESQEKEEKAEKPEKAERAAVRSSVPRSGRKGGKLPPADHSWIAVIPKKIGK